MTESLLTTQTNVQTSIDPNKNYLDELVGDGKKFKNVEDLAKGKYEADLFIESKNRQFDALAEDYKRLRDEYNAGPKLQELIDRLAAANTSSSEPTHTNDDKTDQPTFDPSQIDSLVETKFQEIETKRKAQQNWNTVKERLHEQFGDRFPEVLATQTQKLGLTAEKVDDLARTSPAAFFRMMGLEEQTRTESFQSPPRSSQQSTNFAPNASKARKWSDWKSLLKTQPNLFSDPKSHNQMLDDIKAIGEKAFYDVP